MAQRARQIRVLAVAHPETQETLRRQIQAFGMIPSIVNSAAQLAFHIRAGNNFEVVLLPAVLPNTQDWWEIWGDVAVLSPRPSILVYAQSATFELWSGVLEAGGYDVVIEPLTDEKLQAALLRAAEGGESASPENTEAK